MNEGDNTSHRFLPRIRQELDKFPLTEAQKETLAPRLLEYATFLDTHGGQRTSGTLQVDSPLFDFASKVQAVVQHFQADGLNLDKPLNEGAINLTHAGLQRHRVLFIREMSEEEIRQVGETGPTIDSITVAEFESNDALKEWVSKKAPAFLH